MIGSPLSSLRVLVALNLSQLEQKQAVLARRVTGHRRVVWKQPPPTSPDESRPKSKTGTQYSGSFSRLQLSAYNFHIFIWNFWMSSFYGVLH